MAASLEQDVGAAVQVCKRKGKKEVRPKIATRACQAASEGVALRVQPQAQGEKAHLRRGRRVSSSQAAL